MNTLHERSSETAFARALKDDLLAVGEVLAKAEHIRRMHLNSHDTSLVSYANALGQSGIADHFIASQTYAWAKSHGHIIGGEVAVTMVEVGVTPRRDRERRQNAAALSDLPSSFEAGVDLEQRNAISDGVLIWRKPEKFSVLRSDRPPTTVALQPRSVVLEIGSCLPSRVYFHIALQGRGIARWPYESPWLWIFAQPSGELSNPQAPASSGKRSTAASAVSAATNPAAPTTTSKTSAMAYYASADDRRRSRSHRRPAGSSS